MPVDEAGVEPAGAEVGMVDDRAQERRIDPRPDDDGVGERRGEPIERLRARRAITLAIKGS
jgi:hypothetical protein